MSQPTTQSLKESGMCGFISVRQLSASGCEGVPKVPGVYVVVRESQENPRFLKTGVGGWFKNKNQNVSIAELQGDWVGGASVVYIGKAGSATGSSTLQKRIKQLMGFGMGKKVGHWGGRHIWQLDGHQELIVCWKATAGSDSESVERTLLKEFQDANGGRLPFANLRT